MLLTMPLMAGAADSFAWPATNSQTKPWSFWWWMGSAVDKTNITREMQRYHDAGLGGMHIISIYGAKGSESNYIRYLSPEWMEMMGHSVREARRLGMDVDMTTGTGWCFGGPQVSDQDANANVVLKTYPLTAGQQIPAVLNRTNTQAVIAFGPDGKSIELTDSIGTDGKLGFTPPSNWAKNGAGSESAIVYVITQKPSGQKVKRPAPGGEGWMLNLIYGASMDRFLEPFSRAFSSYKGPKPRAQYHDSYEYKSDWSPDFFAQFEKRRGYRLQTELPALFSKNPDDHAARVLCDYRETVSEIMAGDSLAKWTKWAHDLGCITRDQAHGSPGNWLDLYATADIPETEMFSEDRNILISKFASSAAHVTGKPLTSAETGTWLKEHFQERLSDLKYLLDDMFLSGVNHVFYHGCCYSPDEAGWPGWHFYAATEMNPRNSIWRDVPALNTYASHCQSILQSGKPDNDVLLYWPIEDFWMQPGDTLLPHLTVHARDWFERQPMGIAAKALWAQGQSFDYVSDSQLQHSKVSSGKIMTAGGEYKVIVVPACEHISLEAFRKILQLAGKGACVIFQNRIPGDISGEHDLAARRGELKELTSNIRWMSQTNPTGTFQTAHYGKGELLCGGLETALEHAGIKRETMADNDLHFIRRKFGGGWNYFLANRSTNDFAGTIHLARDCKSIVCMDPMTGVCGLASPLMQDGISGTTAGIRVELRAGESIILRAFEHNLVKGPAWPMQQPDGETVEIKTPWKVEFTQGGPLLPQTYETPQLASWTTFPDTNCQSFAGTAKYETTFSAPLAGRTNEKTCNAYTLTLGKVRQSARVRLNGKDYGTLITPPFSVLVDNLKPDGNHLEVEVTSISANRIRDLDRRGVAWKIFNDINFVDIRYKRFDASQWPIEDCGLMGPVTLTPMANRIK